MIIEQHYDEEVLAEFLAEPQDAVSRDKHLASCDRCRGTLDSLNATTQVLREPAIWDKTALSTAPRPETLAFLRGVAKTMADEDAAAQVWVKELLAVPRERWAAKLEQHPEWRTGGMVRGLLKESDRAITTTPADAVELTAAASNIAEGLGETTVARHLQGLAAYDRGYAFWYTGSVIEALDEFSRARSRLAGLPGAEFDCARIDVVRTVIYQTLERRDEALTLAKVSAEIFLRYEDADRFAAARSAAAITLQTAQRLREALAIHAEIADSKKVGDRWRVSAAHNMGLCYSELGEFDRAVECLVRAIAGYERLRIMTSRTKSRWALGEVFAKQQQYSAALALFNDVRQEFEELGMANDVAMVSLDIADALLALDRMGEIGEACRTAIAYFAGAGLAQTEPALRALAYLQEAAVAGRLTPATVNHVRGFLLAPSDRPQLLFLEPSQ